jgi:hypothetical protein|tara:strand:- start:21 stop:2309 length:2289 start_codon:yes stop_codon:yes gene_type:complete
MKFTDLLQQSDAPVQDDTIMGGTAEDWQKEAEKYIEDFGAPSEITWKDVGNVVADFTPIIGDIKGGYETVQFIGDELDKENPNYYLIGALGGLGAVATIVGLVPGAGDIAQKAIMSGARMAADRANKLVDALPEYDPNTVGSNLGNVFTGKATKEELDPVRLTGSSKGFYKNKAPNYVPDIDVQSTDQGLLMPKKALKIEDLKGSKLIPLLADRTDAGKVLTGLRGGARDYDFEVPIDLEGGRGFMRNPYTGAFASMESVMKSQAKEAAEIGREGFDAKAIYMSMSPEGGDFSTMMSDVVIEMMKQSPIKKKDMNQLTKWVKTNVDPNFIGFDNLDDAKKYLKENVVGTRRQLIWKELDKGDYVDKGFPTMGDARVAISDPELLISPNLQGTSVANFDTSGKLITGPVQRHSTYDSQIGPTGAAGYAGELEAVPYEILMRDFFESRRANNIPSSGDQRSLTMSNISSEVDDQMIEEVNQYINLIEQAEKDLYIDNISKTRQDRKIYKFGDNGGPPLNDPPLTNQMDAAFADELEIGTSQFNVENPDVVLKNHTLDDLEAIDLSRSTAGGPKKNVKIGAIVKEGEEKSIRLNLSSKIDPDGPPAPFNRLQTVHPIRSNGTPNYSEAESYLPAVTVTDGTFHVDQGKRRAIAEDGKKVPAMSVQGNFTSQRNVLNEMDDTVVEVGINPFDKHLFIDMRTGQAVKGFDIATVYRDRVYAKGVTYWKKSEAPKPLPAKGDAEIVNQVRYKFNKGGLVTGLMSPEEI